MPRRVTPVIVDDRYATGEAYEVLPVNPDRRDSFISVMLKLSAMWNDEPRDVPISEIYKMWYKFYEHLAEEDEMETDRTDNWLTQPQVAGQALREIIKGSGEDPAVWIRNKRQGHFFKLNHRTLIPMLWNFGEILWHSEFEPSMHISKKFEVIAQKIAGLCQSQEQIAFLSEFSEVKVKLDPSNLLDW
jgi:hypothetical protein